MGCRGEGLSDTAQLKTLGKNPAEKEADSTMVERLELVSLGRSNLGQA